MTSSERSLERLSTARWLGFAIWAACAGYALLYLYRGWIPWDVGTLGQAAERVLAGELPHRDFTEVYTGGLAFLNAAAFALAGVGMAPMRWVLYGAYVLWIPAVWYLANRCAPRLLAATATLLAAAMTLPMYSEGMPSWYNLFLATWGLVALVRYLDTGHIRWLFVAGLAGGVSITFKIIGLYFLTAAFLFLVYVEHAGDSRSASGAAADGSTVAGGSTAGSTDGSTAGSTDGSTGSDESPQASDTSYRAVVAVMLGLLVAVVLLFAGRSGGIVGILYYATPTLTVVAVLLGRLRTSSGRPAGARFTVLARSTSILLAGAALPVLVLTVPCLLAGALGDLVHGVLVLPFARFERVTAPFPAPRGILAAGVAVWLVTRAPSSGDAGRRIAGAILIAALAVLLALQGNVRIHFEVILHLGALIPVLVLAGAWSLAAGRAASEGLANGRGEPEAPLRFLVLAATALLTLVHLPTPASPYVFYVAPVAVLLTLSIGGHADTRLSGRVHVCVMLALGVIVLHMNPMFIRPPDQTEPFALERARGIRVAPGEKSVYETLVEIIEEHGGSEYLLAIPDSPEVYFLTGLKNPLASFYDLFEDPEGRTERILAEIDELGVDVIVINGRPSYSSPVAPDLLEALQARYPEAVTVGRFVVAWAGEGR